MKLYGYHTLEDRNNAEEIQLIGPRKCTRANAWLGDGYYFWDSSEKWAHDWGVKGCKGRYMIFRGEIVIDQNAYDLYGNVAQQEAFWALYEELKRRKIIPEHELTVGKILAYMIKNGLFPYHTIRAGDMPNQEKSIFFGTRQKEVLRLGSRVQICLLEQETLNLQSFRVIYPEHYIKQ